MCTPGGARYGSRCSDSWLLARFKAVGFLHLYGAPLGIAGVPGGGVRTAITAVVSTSLDGNIAAWGERLFSKWNAQMLT
jgi:hypothetical protein